MLMALINHLVLVIILTAAAAIGSGLPLGTVVMTSIIMVAIK